MFCRVYSRFILCYKAGIKSDFCGFLKALTGLSGLLFLRGWMLVRGGAAAFLGRVMYWPLSGGLGLSGLMFRV